MKGQPQTQYKMTIRNIDGLELDTRLGSLLDISEYLGEHCYTRIDGYFDNYHKLRRELLRAGGAYSCYYPAGERPILLTILEQKFVPAPRYESDESIALRNMPLSPSVARVIENQKELARQARGEVKSAQMRAFEQSREIIPQHPSFYSGFNQPAPAPTADCANCGTTVEAVDGRGHCPYCVDLFNEKPSPVTFPLHSHPTLTWDKMSKWQRKQYVIKS